MSLNAMPRVTAPGTRHTLPADRLGQEKYSLRRFTWVADNGDEHGSAGADVDSEALRPEP
jgi:hypothetical protein